MKKIICYFKKHTRGRTERIEYGWYIECKRCGYIQTYDSPWARLIGTELRLGFDGN